MDAVIEATKKGAGTTLGDGDTTSAEQFNALNKSADRIDIGDSTSISVEKHQDDGHLISTEKQQLQQQQRRQQQRQQLKSEDDEIGISSARKSDKKSGPEIQTGQNGKEVDGIKSEMEDAAEECEKSDPMLSGLNSINGKASYFRINDRTVNIVGFRESKEDEPAMEMEGGYAGTDVSAKMDTHESAVSYYSSSKNPARPLDIVINGPGGMMNIQMESAANADFTIESVDRPRARRRPRPRRESGGESRDCAIL